MYMIMGGTGHIGCCLANILLDRGHDVAVLTRNKMNAVELVQKGAKLFEVDIHDTHALHGIFLQASRLYVLNPPASPKDDIEIAERRTIASITSALKDTYLERIVVQSTYGAQKGANIADLGSLFELEQKIHAIYRKSINLRAAFFMSNWKSAWEEMNQTGEITSVYPVDLVMPMVAPDDIAACAARLLTDEIVDENRIYIEGPKRYSVADVVQAFSAIRHKAISCKEIENENLEQYYRHSGFAASSARSYARMASKNRNGEIELPQNYWKGQTALIDYFRKYFLK